MLPKLTTFYLHRFIVSTSLAVLVFPVYTLLGLRYVEGFPAPSFDFIYEVVTVAVILSYVKGWVVNRYYQTALGTFAKAFYVFLGAPWFVLFLVRGLVTYMHLAHSFH